MLQNDYAEMKVKKMSSVLHFGGRHGTTSEKKDFKSVFVDSCQSGGQ